MRNRTSHVYFPRLRGIEGEIKTVRVLIEKKISVVFFYPLGVLLVIFQKIFDLLVFFLTTFVFRE